MDVFKISTNKIYQLNNPLEQKFQLIKYFVFKISTNKISQRNNPLNKAQKEFEPPCHCNQKCNCFSTK